MHRSNILIVVLALGFGGCAQYSTVTERPAQFRPIRSTVQALASAQAKIVTGLSRQSRRPVDAMGDFLIAADVAGENLRAHPNDAASRDAYNFAVARVFDTIRKGNLDPWSAPLAVPSDAGSYRLTYLPLRLKIWSPAQFDFTPADQFDVRGTYVTRKVKQDGVGAPLVAIGKEKYQQAEARFAPSRIFYGVTGSIAFDGPPNARRAVLQFDDPLATNTVSVNGRTYPIAADFTVPVAVMLARENPKKLELTRLLRPAKYAETAHIVRLQPYDPNKTVVLVTHGLMDSPATWTPMINELRGDPFIRSHFQFWFYSYPSGYAYPYSASILRHQLDAIEREFPLRKPIVLIGHSMGSMISRLMITDSGDRLWLSFFGKPPAQTHLSPESRKLLEDSLIFKHRREVGRVIFISGPHRGSDLATNWVGRIGSGLVKAPVKLLKVGNEMRAALQADPSALNVHRLPNSIDTLAPNNRFVKAVNTIPITPGIPYHSIMGDRGKGGNRDHTPPVSSDGIVPYWSSHLDGAKSELIVPSNHSAHQNEQAIAEVRRILRLHAGARK